MDSSKRVCISKSKMKKMEEVAAKLSSARESLEGSSDAAEVLQVQFSVVRQTDISSVLPRYTTILSRTFDDGVKMKDLDQIQQDLEKLLSTCAVRQRALRSDVESIDKVEERKDRRGKSYDKPSSVKRRKVEEKPRHKNARNILRSLKIKQTVPVGNLHPDVNEVPLILKHDTSDRFWLSVDSYCQDVSKDNLVFLEELIKECSEETDVKIPVLGEHYATEWSEHGIQDEQSNGCITDSLQEEKAIASLLFTTVLDKFKSGDYIKGVNGIRNGLCLEKRLRKEGILDEIREDFSKSISREDEILIEIKKCQKELETVNQHNLTELNKLRDVVRKDIRKQEVKAALEKVDREVLNMYNKVLQAKEKQQEDLSEFEAEANAIIRQQGFLHSELTGLSDLTLLE